MAGVSLRGKQTSWWFHPTSLKAWITASIPQWKGTANWNILKPRIRSIKIRILMVVKAPHCCWLTRLLLVLKSPGPLKNVCHTGLREVASGLASGLQCGGKKRQQRPHLEMKTFHSLAISLMQKMFIKYYLILLIFTGGWLTYPSEKYMSSSLGIIIIHSSQYMV